MKNAGFVLLLLFALGGEAVAQPYLSWVDSAGASGKSERFYKLRKDQNGDYIATGASDFSAIHQLTSIGFDHTGQRAWTDISATPGGDIRDMASDASGNYYTAGVIGYSAHVVKYDSMGNIVWSVMHLPPGAFYADAAAITLDASGNTYACGYSQDSTGNDDFLVIKLNPAGQIQWTDVYDWSGEGDRAYGIAVDAPGNVYVCGGVVMPSSSNNLFGVRKYTASGQPAWQNSAYLPGNAFGEARGIAVDALEQVYITGYAGYNVWGGTADIFTVKIDTAGQLIWRSNYNSFGGQTGSQEEVDAIALDGAGNVYVAGVTKTDTTINNYADIVIIKYDPSGNEVWHDIQGCLGTEDKASDIVVDPVTERIYVAGWYNNNTMVPGQMNDFLMMCWCQSLPCPQFVDVPEAAQQENISVFPNPAIDQVTIQLPQKIQNAALEIFDARGALLEKRTLSGSTATIDVGAFAEGVYVLILREANGAVHRRLLARTK